MASKQEPESLEEASQAFREYVKAVEI